ncbi:uncharacterized protein LOC121377354 isoform X1 [Gigantopelta aegis]|uniref:uncharacterized protein LOC121377354 isoform X1 n=1 Tax=Gigantopelta aegis TaxID=1735272 RepID=UPI001B888CBA|nr:uncharacterized protein LOC121377354 isoform X1 [Gigantopelta aegis]
MMHEELENVRKERDGALNEVERLNKCLNACNMSAISVEGNNVKCQMMTGIRWTIFQQLFLMLSTYVSRQGLKETSLPFREQLFMTFVKLRHNPTFEFLAQLKGIPKSTAIDYFWKWLNLLHAKIGFMVKWQDRERIFQTIPPVFQSKFPKLTSIIDCFEIFIETPRNLQARAKCWSNYKKHCTIKVFVSCSPHGHVNFLSPVWGGRVSDVQIVRESGFISLKYHLPGDQILADRGFTLTEDFATQCSAELIMPAFTKGKKQLSAKEVETSRQISSVRIHIERVIGLMKNRFGILQGPLPIRVVQSLKNEADGCILASCDIIVGVCAALNNLGQSIVFHE